MNKTDLTTAEGKRRKENKKYIRLLGLKELTSHLMQHEVASIHQAFLQLLQIDFYFHIQEGSSERFLQFQYLEFEWFSLYLPEIKSQHNMLKYY